VIFNFSRTVFREEEEEEEEEEAVTIITIGTRIFVYSSLDIIPDRPHQVCLLIVLLHRTTHVTVSVSTTTAQIP
jgi:hypothetical protein